MKKSRFNCLKSSSPPLFFKSINFEFPKFLRKLIRNEKIVLKFSRFAWNLPPFFTSINFEFPKFLRKLIRSEKIVSRFFAIHLKSIPLFSSINFEVNSKWKNRDSIDRSNSIPPPPSFFHNQSITIFTIFINQFRIFKIIHEKYLLPSPLSLSR